MLYRKYRPKNFSEIVGQEHVVKTLKGALTSGRIGHAYLFTGSRGTGKTSLARIFAKALNCVKKTSEPCDTCHTCLAVNNGNSFDLIEIDAASRTGVDNMRELIESAMVAAPGGEYKVFLIDEVHMLSKSAFNALLKTLEEPPAHVVFILATTEPHKILPTVLSRVQRFDFKRLNQGQISEKLKMMAAKEGIKISDGAVRAIAMSSDGALRDAEVALSKVQSSLSLGAAEANAKKEITSDDVNEVLGLTPYKYYPEFVGYLLNKDRANAMELVHKIHMSGTDLENFAGNLVGYMRNVLMAKINPAVLASVSGNNDEELKNISALGQSVDGQRLVKMILSFSSARNEIKHSPVPQLPLELAVIELTVS